MLSLSLALAAATQAPAKAPSEIVAAAPASAWRDIPAADLLMIELDSGSVTIQLAPAWAPPHVANIVALAKAHWWDGTSINRVQDNYVVQWGDATEKKSLPAAVSPTVPPDYVRRLPSSAIRSLGDPDAYAKQTGHAGGWPVASDGAGTAWLAHCYATVGVGRNLAPDTGSGAELYAVIGHAPRHLERNIAAVGRVIDGIERLSALPRGTGALGFYEAPEQRIAIRSVRLGSDMTAPPHWQYLDETSAAFTAYAAARANRRDPFFNLPAGGADICNVPVPIRRAP